MKTVKGFDFEVITEGNFIDSEYDTNVTTIIIKLNSIALNEWIMSSILNDKYTYDTKDEWEEYRAGKRKERKEWERKILDKLQFAADKGYAITKSVSEIFTVVLFEKIEKEGKE